MTLRVLQVAARFLPDLGGIETHVAEVGRRLARRPDVDVTVLTTSTRPGFAAESRTGDGLRVIRRRAWPRDRDWYAAPGIAAVIGSGEWDLVHVQGVHTLVPPVAMAAALRARVPYLVTFHTGGHSLAHRNAARGLQWKVLAPLLRRAEALVAVGAFEQQLFQASTGLPAERFAVIRNGGGLPLPEDSRDDVKPVPGRILSIGRLERYKGHHRVVQALPHLVRRVPEAHLQILGAGPEEGPLRRLARELGVAGRVCVDFLPPGDRAGMARTLRQASAVAAFSDYEAHPVAVMEALALGLPVLGYDIAGVGDLVADGSVHGLSPGATPAQAADALARLLQPGAGTGGARRAPVELPTWDGAADALAQLYRRIADLRAVPVPVA